MKYTYTETLLVSLVLYLRRARTTAPILHPFCLLLWFKHYLSVVAINRCRRQVLADSVVIAINYSNSVRSLGQIHIYAIYSQVITVIPTNLKFILIICFRALNPHSPFSPSSSKTWNGRIFKIMFIKALFKPKLICSLFKMHMSHTCLFPPLCSCQSNVPLCPAFQFYSSLILRKLVRGMYLISFHKLTDTGRVNCYL